MVDLGLDSILDNGYHPIENIIVQETDKSSLIVREGNRRIASLKIALGLISCTDIPQNIKDKINSVDYDWKETNKAVPCFVYLPDESDVVDKIVSRTHGKGEKAAREPWNAVARSRHDRSENRASTPGLDLLEAYLKNGRNLSHEQAERWAGDYPLTVLDEAISKIAPVLGFPSKNEMVYSYPKKNKKKLDQVLFDIGIGKLKFPEIRDKEKFFGDKYGIFRPQADTGPDSPSDHSGPQPDPESNPKPSPPPKKPSSAPLNDPKSVKRKLQSLKPKGPERNKITTLVAEIKSLVIARNPLAFCFLLRCMFELSAKAYCDDHSSSGGPRIHDRKGREKTLATLLRDVVKHITQNGNDKQKEKELHGAITELAKDDGILSIRSMNQLIHHPSFSIQLGDICIFFNNVFPLLEEMN